MADCVVFQFPDYFFETFVLRNDLIITVNKSFMRISVHRVCSRH